MNGQRNKRKTKAMSGQKEKFILFGNEKCTSYRDALLYIDLLQIYYQGVSQLVFTAGINDFAGISV